MFLRIAFAVLLGVFAAPALAEGGLRCSSALGTTSTPHRSGIRGTMPRPTTRLEALGFEVFGSTDLDRRALVEALIRFGRAAETAEAAMFFYAGHGLQVNGQNYLVPIDAMVEFEAEVDISLVSLSQIMQQLERGSRTKSRLPRRLPRQSLCQGTGALDRQSLGGVAGQGARPGAVGSGTFIAFATQPDAVAADGAGANSLTALLKHIDRPGQSISDMISTTT